MAKGRGKSTEAEMDELDDAQLEELYAWIDGFPLTRPKRNIARDFADGVMVAEIIKDQLPKLIQIHSYPSANSRTQKTDNWLLLNRKVFKQLNFELQKDVIAKLVDAKPFVIEKVLLTLKTKLDRAQWELERAPVQTKQIRGGAKGRRPESDQPEADQNMGTPGRFQGKKSHSPTRGPRIQKISLRNQWSWINDFYWPEYQEYETKKFRNFSDPNEAVPRLLYEEKAQECLAKDETLKILQAKINRMEHLIHLKDVRIDDLQNRVEQMRPTGNLRR